MRWGGQPIPATLPTSTSTQAPCGNALPLWRGSRRSRAARRRLMRWGGGRRAAKLRRVPVEAAPSRFVALRGPSWISFLSLRGQSSRKAWSLVGWGGNPCHGLQKIAILGLASLPGDLQPDPGQPVGPPGSFLFVAAGRFDLGAPAVLAAELPRAGRPAPGPGGAPGRSGSSSSGRCGPAFPGPRCGRRSSAIPRAPRRGPQSPPPGWSRPPGPPSG